MDWSQVESKWEQLKGDVKSTWGKLTNDDLTFVRGQKDKLVGKIKERYGILEEQARGEVDAWVARASARIDRIGEKRGRDDRPTTSAPGGKR
jgi:uncharacterized protein YjbJ (UPF0337 family)